MNIFVIRHGITELNKQRKVNGQIDEPLSLEGAEQAKATIPIIPKSIRYIYTSPLIRARQTAEIINTKLNHPIFSIDELTEIHMGTLAGYSWEEMELGEELKKRHRTVQFDYRPYGGESVKEVKKRVTEFLKKLKKKHKDNEVLIITHGGIIRLLYLLEQNKVVDETEKHVSLLTFDLDKIIKNSTRGHDGA
ncbi:MAG: hypothetical protein A2698_00545 [Candidatus Levybacteria bacterium RIFCSPHIGHO2_01_FULL_42_15]|nr:MAG: hypothetical protein A2698_00545 [Candidatus Levybacteria bacterium RIFCSPHIGHO2_01_FULL_42_15]